MPRVMYITDFHFVSFCFELSWILRPSSDVSALLHVSLEECSICLDKYLPKQKTIILECGHKYHTQCITQWLLKDLSCPDCRTIIEI